MTASSTGLLGVTEFVVVSSVVEDTVEFLLDRGRLGCEGFVIWAGEHHRERFNFSSVAIPKQTAVQTEHGLLVMVAGEDLFRVNRHLYGQGLVAGGQVHSHPTDAYHSDTDDHYPLVNVLGGLSGVVPDFGRSRLPVEQWAWYRLTQATAWQAVTPPPLRVAP
jgi:hypothetical protein